MAASTVIADRLPKPCHPAFLHVHPHRSTGASGTPPAAARTLSRVPSPGARRRGLSMPALGGRAHPCARLGLVTVAPRGPEWTRSRRAAGAGLAGSGVAAGGGSAVLRSSVAVVRAAAFRRVVLRASLRALRRWVAGAEDRCPWCGRASCRPVASPDGSVVFAGCD